MRFTPHQGIYAYERTNRKLKAAERRLRLDREKFPLFSAEIAESQPTPEDLLDARGKSFVANQQDNRDRAARNRIAAPSYAIGIGANAPAMQPTF